MFWRTSRVCSEMEERSILPVAGFQGVMPDTKRNEPEAWTARLYGPRAGGESGNGSMGVIMGGGFRAVGAFDFGFSWEVKWGTIFQGDVGGQ